MAKIGETRTIAGQQYTLLKVHNNNHDAINDAQYHRRVYKYKARVVKLANNQWGVFAREEGWGGQHTIYVYTPPTKDTWIVH